MHVVAGRDMCMCMCVEGRARVCGEGAGRGEGAGDGADKDFTAAPSLARAGILWSLQWLYWSKCTVPRMH